MSYCVNALLTQRAHCNIDISSQYCRTPKTEHASTFSFHNMCINRCELFSLVEQWARDFQEAYTDYLISPIGCCYAIWTMYANVIQQESDFSTLTIPSLCKCLVLYYQLYTSWNKESARQRRQFVGERGIESVTSCCIISIAYLHLIAPPPHTHLNKIFGPIENLHTFCTAGSEKDSK